jgi:hypothetical protein
MCGIGKENGEYLSALSGTMLLKLRYLKVVKLKQFPFIAGQG